MRTLTLFLTAWLVCVPEFAGSVVNFPGPIKEVRAPNSKMRVYYVDPGENKSGSHEYSLRLGYPSGRNDEIDVFMRNVDVSWSPSGNALYVSDMIGSNVADCLVVTPNSHKTQKVSMTDMVKPSRFARASYDFRHATHGYVVCDGWIGSSELRFEVYGDVFPREFHYDFTYDLKRGTAEQISPLASKLNR